MRNPDMTPPLTRWLPWEGPDELAETRELARDVADRERQTGAIREAAAPRKPKARKELTWADFESPNN